MATDSRSRAKIYLDTYWTAANCTNDRGGLLGTQVMYAYPEYPLWREFKKPSAIDVIIAIHQSTSTAMMDAVTQAPYGYRESTPMDIVSADKANVTATNAIWQAEAEMRRILETYPTGSLRCLQEARPSTQRLGGVTLWSARYVWEYRRDTTT